MGHPKAAMSPHSHSLVCVFGGETSIASSSTIPRTHLLSGKTFTRQQYVPLTTSSTTAGHIFVSHSGPTSEMSSQ